MHSDKANRANLTSVIVESADVNSVGARAGRDRVFSVAW